MCKQWMDTSYSPPPFSPLHPGRGTPVSHEVLLNTSLIPSPLQREKRLGTTACSCTKYFLYNIPHTFNKDVIEHGKCTWIEYAVVVGDTQDH